jgi:predicted enzyme related to lactoylglutathione lyase
MGAPFVWFDLTAADGAGTSTFYRDLFGWTIGPGMGDYEGWITDGDQPWAGILTGESGIPGRWVPYVAVADLDAAVKQATTLGGTVVREKADGPAGSSVMVADPGGAVVALFTPAAG